ncbi:MAG TPA: hypothetical protein VLC71_08865 [Thermomonas sp.]|nr:hypothetical protein [Thermomonas sp.]
MTRLPREPLDADERALAARLPRLHGRDEPDAALDARILAAAHAAVTHAPAAKRRRGWIVPLTAAASLSLAVGLAWQLQPPPSPYVVPASAPVASDSTAIERGMPPQQALGDAETAPADVAAKPMAMPLPAMRQAIPAGEGARLARQAPPAEPVAESVAAAPMLVPPPPPAVATDAAPVASAPAPPPAPPAPEQAAAARSSGTLDSVMVSGAATREQAKRARENEAEAAAEALASEQFAKDLGEEDVPPATMDAPAARDAWLRRIGELQQQGRIDDAKASLGEFRRRYPDAVLPPELRKLEP